MVKNYFKALYTVTCIKYYVVFSLNFNIFQAGHSWSYSWCDLLSSDDLFFGQK